MCGISGIATPSSSGFRVDDALLCRMRDTLRHRGPDDAGNYLGDGIGLAHRRLSIVDLKLGKQPMSCCNERFHIVFNGEIYNHRDCRPALEQSGHRFNTQSDTEAILRLYAEHGIGCVSHLRGMFAFAIWDKKKKTVFGSIGSNG